MKTIFASILILAASGASAQFHMGLKAGGNTVGMTLKEFSPNATFEEATAPDRRWGYHAGIFAYIGGSGFFVQPEVLYTDLNNTVKATASGANQSQQNYQLNYQRVDAPVLIGTTFGPVRIMGGGVYSLNLPEDNGPLADNLENGTLGYQVGAGLELGKVFIDFRFEGPITKTARKIVVNNTRLDTDLRVNQFIACFSYQFF